MLTNIGKSYHLYLFLHTRSLLSAAVRLNLIGPYLSSQLLLHPTRGMIERHALDANDGAEDDWPDIGGLCKCQQSPDLTPGEASGKESLDEERRGGLKAGKRGEGKEEDFWAWTLEAEKGPATTWPLGEVLIGRHDLQHSRIFNS
jgi:urease accessory protein